MKSSFPLSASVAMIISVVGLAFVVGKSLAVRDGDQSSGRAPDAVARAAPSSATAAFSPEKTIANRMPKQLHGLTVEQARRLTPEQRLACIAGAALVHNPSNQMEMLNGLVGALGKDEILQAADLLGGAQDRGNLQPQEIWIALWTQWGRVDPIGGLQHFVDRPGGKGQSDARSIMHGWLETAPDAAVRWAHEPKTTMLDAAAAALAISYEADGDLRKMEAAMLAVPEIGPTRTECADRYFDMAELAGDGLDPAATYDALPEALRSAAWPTAFTRISRGESGMTMEWVKDHYEDDGRDDEAMRGFIERSTEADSLATLAWTRTLPYQGSDTSNPTVIALRKWMNRDPPQAIQWMSEQPADTPWLKPFQPFLKPRNK